MRTLLEVLLWGGVRAELRRSGSKTRHLRSEEIDRGGEVVPPAPRGREVGSVRHTPAIAWHRRLRGRGGRVGHAVRVPPQQPSFACGAARMRALAVAVVLCAVLAAVDATLPPRCQLWCGELI